MKIYTINIKETSNVYNATNFSEPISGIVRLELFHEQANKPMMLGTRWLNGLTTCEFRPNIVGIDSFDLSELDLTLEDILNMPVFLFATEIKDA